MIDGFNDALSERLAQYVNPRRLVPEKTTQLWQSSNGGATIVSEASYQTDVIRLDETGAFLWDSADGKTPLGSITATLCPAVESGFHPSVALARAIQFYRRLEEQGVLHFREFDGPSLPLVPPVDVLLLTVPDPIHYLPEAASVAENSAPPLGLLYVASGLAAAGLSVGVADLNIWGADLTELRFLVENASPRVVGISVLTGVSEIARVMLHVVRRIDPDIVRVAGGPHPSVLPQHMLHDGAADVVVRGEADRTMVDLVRTAIDKGTYERVPGISYMRDGQVISTPDAPAIVDLDSLPFPERALVGGNPYLQGSPLITSRGCIHNCLFCSSVLLRGRRFRPRSVSGVSSELDLLLEQGDTNIEVQDDDLGSDTARLREIAEMFRSRSVRWACQCTIRSLNESPSTIDLLARAGCGQVFSGIESGHDPIMKRGKGITRSDVNRAVKRVVANGMRAVASFIIGWPDDDVDTVQHTIDFALELREQGVHTPFSILTPFPGTPLYGNPERYGITIENSDFSDYTFSRANISTRHLTRDDLTRLYLKAVLAISDTYPYEEIEERS